MRLGSPELVEGLPSRSGEGIGTCGLRMNSPSQLRLAAKGSKTSYLSPEGARVLLPYSATPKKIAVLQTPESRIY